MKHKSFTAVRHTERGYGCDLQYRRQFTTFLETPFGKTVVVNSSSKLLNVYVREELTGLMYRILVTFSRAHIQVLVTRLSANLDCVTA